MSKIKNTKIAILATHGFEKSELFVPKEQLEAAGATVSVISPESGSIKSWDEDDWGKSTQVDVALSDANISDYAALVLPGGQINPDLLRANDEAVKFVHNFVASGKPVAAICHAPWLLVEAGVVKSRRMTSYHSIKTDVKNAGAQWEDSEVVMDKNLITSRSPEDLDAFCAKIIEAVQNGMGKGSDTKTNQGQTHASP